MARSRFQAAAALVFAIASVSAFASPAAAETTLKQCTGVCGTWQAFDQSDSQSSGMGGAACNYQSGTNSLSYISIRPPLINGHYAKRTKVQWRFKIRHADSYTDPNTTIYKSSWQSATASRTVGASEVDGFTRRQWNVGATPAPSGSYSVWIEMRWWHAGSVAGTARIEYDYYDYSYDGSVQPGSWSEQWCADLIQ